MIKCRLPIGKPLGETQMAGAPCFNISSVQRDKGNIHDATELEACACAICTLPAHLDLGTGM